MYTRTRRRSSGSGRSRLAPTGAHRQARDNRYMASEVRHLGGDARAWRCRHGRAEAVELVTSMDHAMLLAMFHGQLYVFRLTKHIAARVVRYSICVAGKGNPSRWYRWRLLLGLSVESSDATAHASRTVGRSDARSASGLCVAQPPGRQPPGSAAGLPRVVPPAFLSGRHLIEWLRRYSSTAVWAASEEV